MTEFDYALIGIVSISVLLGLWRGAVYEVLSILGWPLAFLASRYAAPQLATAIPIGTEQTRVTVSYVGVFIAVLLLWAILAWLFSKLGKAVGLGLVDGMLGGVFGVLRGVLVVIALIWVAGLTHIPEQRFWREAKYSSAAEAIALKAKLWLPDEIAQRIAYRVKN